MREEAGSKRASGAISEVTAAHRTGGVAGWFKRTKRRIITPRTIPYFLYLPCFVITVGILYPFFRSVYFSFTDYNLTYRTAFFIGFENYIEMLTSADFWNSVRATLTYAGWATGVELVLGFAMALLLLKPIRGRTIYRAIILLPFMIPPVIEAIMMRLMLAPVIGVVNYLGSFVGMPRLGWFGEASTAMLSVVLIDVHNFTPFAAIILLAGLQSLPARPFEAARVDGASTWFIFRKLTIPLLKPVIYVVVLFRLIESLIMFDMIYAGTKGGPAKATMTLHLNAYYYAMRWTMMGEAFVQLVILWGIVFVCSFIIVRAWRRALGTRLI
ncbi:MAG: sugar ABC transporter permease [Deltaproteobacteria bacterium]|nr:sugar ABC transporter permease [Deltaproteobacteria bacterium]MBW2120887.1 sugar ABC transporter permease [Deltaproteobacteria bacterium]